MQKVKRPLIYRIFDFLRALFWVRGGEHEPRNRAERRERWRQTRRRIRKPWNWDIKNAGPRPHPLERFWQIYNARK